MRKFYAMLMAFVLMAVGGLGTKAATMQVPVKMTYVSGSDADVDVSYGEVTTAYAGYNKISGGAVNLANKNWGVNNVAFLQIDASTVPGPITKVTLSGAFQQIGARGLWYGFGYNSSAWSDALTWNTADRSITLIDGQGVTCSKSTADLEASVDVTPAFEGDADKIVTILVYQTAAGGGYIKDATAEVEYTKPDEVIVNYSFDDAEHPVMVPDGSNSDRGTCNYDFDSPIDGAKFLNVWGENNTNGFKVATITTEDVTTNGQWTLEFDWAGYSGCNDKAGQTKLVDLEGNTFFSIDDAAGWGNTFSLSTGQTVACYPCNKATRISANTGSVLTGADGLKYWHHFTVIGTANGITVTVEQYGKDEGGNITKNVVVKNAKASTTNATPASIGLRPGSCGSVAIDNLKLTVGDMKIVTHNYTVNFIDQNGDPVKDSEIRNAVDGEALAATDADKETIIVGKTKYTYVSDDADERVIDEDDMILNITYEKTTVADYVVNFLNSASEPIKASVTHKNVLVGSEVSATAGELAKMLIDGTFYEYESGNTPFIVSENEEENVLNLVFAPVAGITGYFYNNYEDGSVDWTAGTSGRYTPINADGSKIPGRGASHKELQPKIDPETGEQMIDPETGEPMYEEVDVPDPDVPFGNVTRFLTVDQNSRNNNGGAVNKASLAIDQADFTLEAKILLGSSNNQNGTNLQIKNFAGNANIFQIAQKAEGNTTSWIINNDAENFTVVLPNSGTYTGGDLNNLSNYEWYNLKVTVYNGITFVTITDRNDNIILDKAQVPSTATSYGVGAMQFNSSRYYANFGLDDVTVRSVDTEADIPEGSEFVAVTIEYVDGEGTPLKPSDEVNFQVGEPIVLNESFTADFKVTETGEVWTPESEAAPVTKWIYVEDNSADVEALLGAKVTIVFRSVAPRRVALRYQIQKVGGTITSKDDAGKNFPFFYDSNKTGDVLFEGDELTFYYPYYFLADGLLYKTGANSGNEDHGVLEIEAGTSTQVKTPTTWTPAMETVVIGQDPETGEDITEEQQISNAIFAEESENIAGMTPVKDGYTQIRMANGATGSAIGENVLITTLEPGIYTITSATRSGLTNFLAGDKVVFSVESTSTVQTATSAPIEIAQTTPLYIEEQSATTKYSDYVLIRKTASFDSFAITVTSPEHGTVIAPTAVIPGAEVEVTVTPDEGYEVASITVTGDESGEEIETMYDSWDGVAVFEMPEEAVTVTVTFQQAYVHLSDYTVASDGIVEPDGVALVTGTFTAETAGSYSELFFGDVVFDIAVVPAEGDPIEAVITADDLGGVVRGYVPSLVPGTEYTVKVLGVRANDYITGVEVFSQVAEAGEALAVSEPFTAVQTYEITYSEEIKNGVVTGPQFALEGAEVTLTASPSTGYELESISVTGKTEEIVIPVSEDGKFTMPADGVTVNATFVKKAIYIETDMTAQFASLTQVGSWTGGQNYTSTDYCPMVEVGGGIGMKQVIENYAWTCANTGSVLSASVNGLTPGTYKIELYGGAAFTFNRGFGSIAFTGDLTKATSDTYQAGDKIEPTEESTGVTLFAESEGNTYGGEIPIYYATDFPDGAATVTIEGIVVGESGTIAIGMDKTSQSTNWHVVQLKSVIAQVLASDLLDAAIAKAEAVEETTVPAALYAEIQSTVAIYDQAYETAEEYQEAIDAINAVVAKAEGYAPLTAILNEGETIKGNIPEGNPQIATYDAAVADVKAAYEAVEVADIPAAVAVVNEAITPAFVKAQTAPGSDMTRAIVNPTIQGTSGWTCERPKGGGGPELPAGGALEYWAGSANPRAEAQFDYYQVIEGLPSGKYVVSAEMYNSLNGEGGDYTVFAPTSGVYASSGNDETATLVDVEGTTYNRYATEEVFVKDGSLRLGIKNTELPMAARWFVADNFTLTLVEAIPTYPIYYADGMVGGLVSGPIAAAEGEEVELTVAPEDGYELASISVKNADDEELEVDYDAWDGIATFEMPAEAVYVSATFQEAYVHVSDFAVASDGHIDTEDGTVKITGTYEFETAGSYAEGFFGEVVYDIQITAEGLEAPIEATLTGDVLDGEVDAYVEGLVAGTEYTANLVGVHVWDYISFTEIFTKVAEEGEALTSTEFTANLPYNIYYADGMVGGLVSGPTSAYEGDEVELTVAPEVGYELASLTVVTASEEEVEVMYDAWDGVATFEMPAEAVYVSATFQEAYVHVSDFAVASSGVIDDEGDVYVVGTYTYDAAGSYAEGFFGEVVYDVTIVTDGAEPFEATLSDDELSGEVASYLGGFEAGKEYTVYVDSVHVWDYMSFTEIYTVKAAEGEHLTSTTFTTTQPAIAINLNVERYVGQGYVTTIAEVDFAEAKEFLGVDEITTDMLRIVNPDESFISDYATYDGWFDGDGWAETWGANTKINVKFFEAIPDGEYSICDMNGADVVGTTYTVKWALVANEKQVTYNVKVTFVEAPAVEITTVGQVETAVEYATTDASYTEKVVALTTDQKGEICEALGLADISEGTLYGYNPSDEEFISVFAGYDGWRDKDGDFSMWSGTDEVPACVKYDGGSLYCYNISGCEPQTIYCYWAIVNEAMEAVLIKVAFTYVDPTGLDELKADEGVKADGKYIEGNKVVIWQKGIKYNATGTIAR